MRNSAKAAIGILAVLGAAAPVSVAAAATTSSTTTPSSGPIKVWVTPAGQNTTTKTPGKILITGAIADHGTVITTNAAKKPTTKGSYKLLRFKDGTILVDGAAAEQGAHNGAAVDTQRVELLRHLRRHGPGDVGQWDRCLRRDQWHGDNHRDVRLHRSEDEERHLHNEDKCPAGRYLHLDHRLWHGELLVATDACGAVTRRTIGVWRSRSRRRPGAGRRPAVTGRGRRSLGVLAQLLDQGVLLGRPPAGVTGPGQALSCQLRSCRGGRDGVFQGHRGGSLGQRLVASAPDRPFLVDVGPAAPRAPRAAGALGADALGARSLAPGPGCRPWCRGLSGCGR